LRRTSTLENDDDSIASLNAYTATGQWPANWWHMKSILTATFAVVALSIAGCDSSQEKAREKTLENQADAKEEQAKKEKKAAENAADATEIAGKKQADAEAERIRKEADARAKALKDQADALREQK
jgi:hypothetical protein